mmetsp:Transcript_38477/g.106021  ORF Transcript_38477/g.106021 Transcript_38477/m.106021 type:complete len:330 (+) Transcript_38477:73-1062(+)
MESLRARLKSRLSIKQAFASADVDAVSIRDHWQALTPDARIDALRFEDKAVVQRIHDHMKALCRAECWRSSNSVDESGEPERLKGFLFECPQETDCYGQRQRPTAFVAAPDFAASDGLIEELRLRLGSELFDGRPALQPRDWKTIVEQRPKSWQGLQCQALRLVELALLRSYQDAVAHKSQSSAKAAESEGPDHHEEVSASKSGKRKARKKKATAVMQVKNDQLNESCKRSDQDVCPGPRIEDNHDVERTGDNVGAKKREHCPWSGWLPSCFEAGVLEWHWVSSQRALPQGSDVPIEQLPVGIKAYVKNTFVDVQTLSSEVPRRKSAFF